jgi:hypothetical protein
VTAGVFDNANAPFVLGCEYLRECFKNLGNKRFWNRQVPGVNMTHGKKPEVKKSCETVSLKLHKHGIFSF